MPSVSFQSEYQRSYKNFAFVEDGNAEGHLWRETAGLSSIDLAVTREPALQRRRQSPSKRQQQPKTPPISQTVNALLDPDDGGIGKSRSRVKDDKLQRHRLGCGLSLTAPMKGQPVTEYNHHFTWKAPQTSSPLLAAERNLRTGPRGGECEQKKSTGPRCNGHGGEERDLGRRKVESPEGAEMKNEEGCGGGFVREMKEKKGVHREERDMPSDPQEPSAAVKHGAHGGSHKRHKEHCRRRKKREAGKHRATRIPLSTEYRDQYKKWPLMAPDKSVAPVSNLQKGIPPALLPPAGSPAKLHSPSDRRLQRHSPIKTDIPVVKSILRFSEYQSNYQSPTRRSYINGAWMGAPRPELLMEGDVDSAEPAENGSTWLNQAAELREKSSEYKKRSRGTFFSRDYLDWLESQQQDLLETASNGLLSSLSCSSSCSCPIEGSQNGEEEPVRVEDIEEPITEPAPLLPPSLHSSRSSPPPPEPASLHYPPARQPHTHFRSSPAHSDTSDSSTPSPQAEEKPLPPEEDSAPPLQGDRSCPVAAGATRRPTPDLKGGEEQWGQRHHLNLTTPFANALFSPSKEAHEHKVARTGPVSPKYRRDMKSRAPIFPTDAAQSERVKAHGVSHQSSDGDVHFVHKEAKGISGVEKLKAQRGPKPVPLDREKLQQKHYHLSPSTKNGRRCKSAYIRQTQDGPMCTVCGVNLDPLAAAAQRMRTRTAASHPTPHVSTRRTLYTEDGSPHLRRPALREFGGGRDSPALESVSSLSMTSCSVASEVLERARQRRDHFWAE